MANCPAQEPWAWCADPQPAAEQNSLLSHRGTENQIRIRGLGPWSRCLPRVIGPSLAPDAAVVIGHWGCFVGISDPYWIEEPKSFLSGFKLWTDFGRG